MRPTYLLPTSRPSHPLSFPPLPHLQLHHSPRSRQDPAEPSPTFATEVTPCQGAPATPHRLQPPRRMPPRTNAGARPPCNATVCTGTRRAWTSSSAQLSSALQGPPASCLCVCLCSRRAVRVQATGPAAKLGGATRCTAHDSGRGERCLVKGWC